MTNDFLKPTVDWIKDDYTTNPVRFVIELVAWAISIGCSLTMAATVPDPPIYRSLSYVDYRLCYVRLGCLYSEIIWHAG